MSDVIVLDEESCLVRVGEDHVAIVDRADLPIVAHYRWYVLRDRSGRPRAIASNPGCQPAMVLMHRLIFDPPPGHQTDHSNSDALDNRRSNLRLATASQNGANAWKRPRGDGKPHSSRFKGVYWDEGNRRWRASIRVRGERFWLGAFHDEESAARAYDRVALKEFGEFAWLNLPESGGAP